MNVRCQWSHDGRTSWWRRRTCSAPTAAVAETRSITVKTIVYERCQRITGSSYSNPPMISRSLSLIAVGEQWKERTGPRAAGLMRRDGLEMELGKKGGKKLRCMIEGRVLGDESDSILFLLAIYKILVIQSKQCKLEKKGRKLYSAWKRKIGIVNIQARKCKFKFSGIMSIL